MKLKSVEYLPGAQLVLEEAAAWYEEQELGVGDRFRTIVLLNERKLQRHPLLGTPHRRNPRKWSLPKYPFHITYREENKCIVVIAVAHGKRQEDHWKHRTN